MCGWRHGFICFLVYLGFESYVANPLKKKVDVKVLSSNLGVIKQIDKIMHSLIMSRYSNLNEYKEKIAKRQGLPSFIRSLLAENGCFFEKKCSDQEDLIDANTNSPLSNYDASPRKADEFAVKPLLKKEQESTRLATTLPLQIENSANCHGKYIIILLMMTTSNLNKLIFLIMTRNEQNIELSEALGEEQ